MSVWPVWEVQGHGSGAAGEGAGTGELPPWFSVRLSFADGARIDVVAAVSGDRISIEDLHADPPLPLEGFSTLAEWIEEPLQDACRLVLDQRRGAGRPLPAFGTGYRKTRARHRARRNWPRSRPGRRTAAAAYLAAQEEGSDPVLAVMCATGRSRRRSLKLIASARDEGYLPPRRTRR